MIEMEAIHGIGAHLYSFILRKSPEGERMRKEMADEICAFISSGKILDVGTGPGYLPLLLAKQAHDLEVTGIDLSPAMIEIARNQKETIALAGRVQFHTANAVSLPFDNNYFDMVISTLSMHHWSKPIECFGELWRVMKEGSYAWIYDIRRDTTKETNKKIRQRLGLIPSFIILRIVRLHSSITWEYAQQLISSPELAFSQRDIEDKGYLLKIILKK